MKRWIIGTATVAVVLLVSALILTGPATAQADDVSTDLASATSNDLTANAARAAVDGYLADNGLDTLNVDADGTVHRQPTLMWNATYHSVLTGQAEMAQHGIGGMMNGGQHGQMHGRHGTMRHDGAGMMTHHRLHVMDGSTTGTADQNRLQMMAPAECQQFAAPAHPTTTLAQ